MISRILYLTIIAVYLYLISFQVNSATPEIISPKEGIITEADAVPMGDGALVTFKWTSPPEVGAYDWAFYVGSEVGTWDYRRITHMDRYLNEEQIYPEEEALKIGLPADGRTVYIRFFWRPQEQDHQYVDLVYVTPKFNLIDFDGDGLSDFIDDDDDNDGVPDDEDAFPRDNSESVDTDEDGIGNNADTDDDNDGVNDNNDAFPLDNSESVDTDGDGIGNNADTDDDDDGVSDSNDAFPLDSSESVDTDADGIGNNADTDDDDDGVSDSSDAFPLDASRTTNTQVSQSDASSGGGSSNLPTLLLMLVIHFIRRAKAKTKARC